jgi:Zn finger protein HypA/HybF involved in hydrogenase expression
MGEETPPLNIMGINIHIKCSACHGTGQLTDTQGTPYVCTSCGGSKAVLTQMTLDSEQIEAILAELDYLHGKVTAIWNIVKPNP